MNYCYGKMKNIVSSKVKISNVIFIVCTIEENCNDEEYLITKVGERDQLQFWLLWPMKTLFSVPVEKGFQDF